MFIYINDRAGFRAWDSALSFVLVRSKATGILQKEAAFIIFLMVLRTTFPIVSKKGNTVPKF